MTSIGKIPIKLIKWTQCSTINQATKKGERKGGEGGEGRVGEGREKGREEDQRREGGELQEMYPEEDTDQYTVHETTHNAALALDTLVLQIIRVYKLLVLIEEDQIRLQEMVSNLDQQCKKIWYENLERQDGTDGHQQRTHSMWHIIRWGNP